LMNSEIGGKDTGYHYGIVYAWDTEDLLSTLKDPIESIDPYKPDDRQNELVGNGIVPVNIDLEIKKRAYYLEELESTLRRDIKYALTQFSSSEDYLAESKESPLDMSISDKGDHYQVTVRTFGRTKHPTQIYESISYFVIFLVLFAIWNKYQDRTPEGILLGIFLITVFGMRFIWEFFKESQVDFEDSMAFNMGQLLSIPLVIAGVFLVILALKNGQAKIKN